MGPSAIPVAVGAPGGVWLRLLCASILTLLCERQTQSSLPEFFKTGGIVFKKTKTQREAQWVHSKNMRKSENKVKDVLEQEKKSPENGSPRSRIPRLVLHPFRPKDKSSPLSDSQFSEEEGKECDLSSDHSKRTVSTNSFCSGKTSRYSLITAGFTLGKENKSIKTFAFGRKM
ncbi:unnamed protein product [Tetraodon nigroviridis]|uniref:(spotted green pufferfish) hypothetical protein n=1 Tax=Tetraodon nigroviridis TaxID=99883 RepID=Q4SSW7_TETNG|nr:unnamed protein product [Tetraodon nigroviridis]